jgi:hypothetical protein
MMCWDERKSLAKSSQGRPPVPDGLAHRINLRVPPYLGISVGVGVTVVLGDVVGEVVVIGDVVGDVVVAGDVVGEVVIVGDAVGSPQPTINMVLTRRTAIRMYNLLIFHSLLLIISLCLFEKSFANLSNLIFF